MLHKEVISILYAERLKMEHIPTIIASMMFRDKDTWSYNF